ncbi:substrate-binding domain-containing protein [Magnetovibrio sp.]|uniref:substrate-binding domain-containing protein n=1 Tax=Magnetovibrio sp. TaxID=2024836 RepID=UPI002F94749C
MGDDWERKGISHTTPQPVDLAVALDQQLYPSLGPLIEAFAKDRGIKVAVQNGTCGISAGLLADKAADIGGFCCPPGASDRLPGLKYHTIGIGALALITHSSNPTENIDVDDARKLFGNDIRDWSELPMSGFKADTRQPVRALARLHCKVRPGHWRLILDTEQQFGWDLTEVSAIKDMLQQVSITPGAIGYETLWHIDRLAKENQSVVKTLRVNGMSPHDNDAVARGAYPLYRVFNITSWADGPANNELGNELAAYLVDHAGQIKPEFAIIPASDLRRYGWKFQDTELLGEPN